MENEELNVNEATNETLCNIIICFQYTGLFEERSLECMEELVRRRENGDDFPFETIIEEGVNKLPKFKLDMKKIFSNGYNINDFINNSK